MHDNVFSPDYWDKAGATTNYYAILSVEKYRIPEEFWACSPNVEVMLALDKNQIFLDVGCGFGRVGYHVAPKVKEYYGVDYSKEMVARAKEFSKFSNSKFSANNGKDLSEFPDRMFDIVHTTLMLQHVPKSQIFRYIEEFARVVKANGKIFCYDIPRSDKYVNGLTKEEVEEAFNKLFKDVCIIPTSSYYTAIAGEVK